MKEAELERLVADVARLAGWRRYHTHDSRRSAHGFPDEILVKDGRLLAVELKTERGRVRPAQQDWLTALGQVPGVEAFVWRPADWNLIAETLTGHQ